MMKTQGIMVIASLLLVTLLIATGVVLAHPPDPNTGGVNQGTLSVASGEFSTVSGGLRNTASAGFSTIGGGGSGFGDANPSNTASGGVSTIGGGRANTTTVGSSFSTIAGGIGNTTSGISSSVGGGSDNIASGDQSTVPGGVLNVAAGRASFAAGARARANHDGTFVWSDATGVTTSAEFASTRANQFLIRASGNVGIGTNDPIDSLHVRHSAHGGITIDREDPGASSGSIFRSNRVERWLVGLTPHSDSLTFRANAASDLVVITQEGRVGIGTTNPTRKLHVNGNVLADNVAISSSRQLKTNIRTIEGALEKVQSLRGVSYDWKTDGKHDIGLIAEEVGEVIPEVVVYEENGQDATAVDYAGLVPVLVEAVKEQQQLLEDKDAQIAALQEDNHEFEVRIAALEKSVGTKGAQTGVLPFSTTVMWMMLAGGLGLVLVTPGLVLGYRRIRRDE